MQKNITIHVTNDYAALSAKAAMIFAKQVNENPTKAFGFATGGTPEGTYEELAKMHRTAKVDLSKLTAFNLDEYYPIKPNDPQSYKFFMAKHLFDLVGLPEAKRNIPSGTAADPVAECAAYEEKITASGGIQMQILGIGANGHIGFNEPAEYFPTTTDYVNLAKATIDANARFFDGRPEDVPRHALTMGIGTIMMSKTIMMLASGEGKAKILRDALRGPITPLVPASALQLHQNVIVVADRAAASLL